MEGGSRWEDRNRKRKGRERKMEQYENKEKGGKMYNVHIHVGRGGGRK